MSVKSLIARTNKAAGKNLVARGTDILTVPRFSTGSLSMDLELGGTPETGYGIPEGRVTSFVGIQSAGKSMAVMKATAEYQKKYPEREIIWADAEGVFDPLWAQTLGIDVAHENFWVTRPEYTEQAYNFILDAYEEGAGLCVLDSIAALSPKAEAEADMEAATIGLQARLNRKMLRKFQSYANDAAETVLPTFIYINHLNEDTNAQVRPGMPRPLAEAGGKALKFWPSVKIKLSPGDVRPKPMAGKEDVQPKAYEVKFYVEKNKTAPPFRRGHVWFYFDTLDQNRTKGSYDKVEECIRYALKYGVVLRLNKSTYAVPDPDTGELVNFKGSPAVAEYIRSSEKGRKWVEDTIAQRLKEGMLTDGAPVSEDEESEEDE